MATGLGESHILGSRHYYNDGVLTIDHLPYHSPVNSDSYARQAGLRDPWTYIPEENRWTIAGHITETSFTVTDDTGGESSVNTGFTAFYNGCGLDVNGTEVKNLMELAREKGMLTGISTNDGLQYSVAASVVHVPTRYDSDFMAGRVYIASPDFMMGNDSYIQEYAAGKPLGQIGDFRHFYDWYEANLTENILPWVSSMLNEYDDNTQDTQYYDIQNWTYDRNIQTFNKFSTSLTAVDGNLQIRPLIHFNRWADCVYNPKTETAPCYGYKLGYNKKNGETVLPNYPEMVASTLSVLDKKAKAQDRGFFAYIENYISDSWGHSGTAYDCLNESQVFDEGVDYINVKHGPAVRHQVFHGI